MHAFAYVHAFNALSGACIVCATGDQAAPPTGVTYLLTYSLTYLPTYLPTYLLTYLLTYLPTYLLTYLPTYLQATKLLLLPEWRDGEPDPHDEPLFPWLPPGAVVERNPLPELEPPSFPKPFLGRAIALQKLVLKLGQRRQKEVRLVTLTGPAGVGKSSLAIAAASHLFERRWFPEGCVRVELGGCVTEAQGLAALAEALDMEMQSLSDIGRALKHWRGLLVLDE